MDYEKKYKEALELARKLYNMRGDWTNLEIESIFPELRKSEDEKIRKFLIQMAQNGHGEDRDWWNKCVDWLEKQGEQKHAEWSKEDEYRLNEIILDLKVFRDTNCSRKGKVAYQREIDWLEFLKNKVQPQPKQEWSEEDERKINYLIALLQNSTMNHDDLRVMNESCEDWLKSLKHRIQPQNTWKPSVEEVVALEHAINCYSGISPTNANEVFILEIMKERLKNLTK